MKRKIKSQLKRIGNQEPSFESYAPINKTYSAYVEELLNGYGVKLDAWQKKILDIICATNDDGTPQFERVIFTVPRQNGKTAIVEYLQFYWLVINGYGIVHTAHQLRSAKKSFQRLSKFFTNPKYPELYCGANNKGASHLNKTHGEEGIDYLETDGHYEVINRSAVSGLGFTVDKIVFDEAQEMTDEQLEALSPTLSASKSDARQFIFLGTAPKENKMVAGNVFNRFRERAQSGLLSSDEAYIEWSLPTLKNIDTKEPNLWYKYNPSLGIRITEKFIKGQANSLSKDGFAREHLGYWAKNSKTQYIFSNQQWMELKAEPPSAFEKFAVAIKFTPDGYNLSTTISGINNSNTYTEVINNGTFQSINKYYIGALKHLYGQKGFCGFVIQGNAGRENIKDLLIQNGIKEKYIIKPNGAEIQSANYNFEKLYIEKNLAHFNQPLLNKVALSVEKKISTTSYYGGWYFRSNLLTDITPIESVALSCYFANILKPRSKSGITMMA
jgi:phage terminase large subunit-like protein